MKANNVNLSGLGLNVILRLPHSPVFPESVKIEKFLFMINYCVSQWQGVLILVLSFFNCQGVPRYFSKAFEETVWYVMWCYCILHFFLVHHG